MLGVVHAYTNFLSNAARVLRLQVAFRVAVGWGLRVVLGHRGIAVRLRLDSTGTPAAEQRVPRRRIQPLVPRRAERALVGDGRSFQPPSEVLAPVTPRTPAPGNASQGSLTSETR